MLNDLCRDKKQVLALMLAALLCLPLVACSKKGEGANETGSLTTESGDPSRVQVGSSSDIVVEYTKTDLNDTYDTPTAVVECDRTDAAITGSGIELIEGTLKITSAGCYLLSGEFEGQVLIDAADTDKVQLVLNGFALTYGDASPILCENADKLVITLAEGSVNKVNDSGSGYIDVEDGEEEINTRTGGAIHSKCAMTINGSGSLEVRSTYHHGIFTKKTLKIIGGTISVVAPGDALKGKNAVAIKDGKITLDAGGDGVQCSEVDDITKGYIWIEGGSLKLTAEGDGLDASLYLLIRGGEIDVTTTGTERKVYEASSNESGGMTAPGGMTPPGGGGGFGGMGGGSYSQDGYEVNSDGYYKITSKGLKAGGLLEITGGEVKVVSTGHAVKSDGDILISGDDTALEVTARCEAYRANSKGLSADGALTIAGGDVVVQYAYEGIESAGTLTVGGGSVRVLEAVDDGLNVGTVGEKIVVSGGYLFVNASGDGIDSNGNLEIGGGTVIVAGPTNSGNGALDHGDGNYGILISGGTLIAYGASGMAEVPSTSSTQCSISYNTSLQSGDIFYITDSKGETVAAVELLKNAQNIVVSSPSLAQGETYTLHTGGSADGANADGAITGAVSGGSELGSLTLSSVVTSNGGNMGGGFGGGMDMPGGGGMGGGMAPPNMGGRPR